MIASVSELKEDLTQEQRAFMDRLLMADGLHPDEVEIELVEVERAVEGIDLILPPGCRTIKDLHDRIEQRLIWVPGDAAES